jgi:hypothetical protein
MALAVGVPLHFVRVGTTADMLKAQFSFSRSEPSGGGRAGGGSNPNPGVEPRYFMGGTPNGITVRVRVHVRVCVCVQQSLQYDMTSIRHWMLDTTALNNTSTHSVVPVC